jgi:hypothetical protein
LPSGSEHSGRVDAQGVRCVGDRVAILAKHGEGGGCCAVCVCSHNVPTYRGRAGKVQVDSFRITLCDNTLHLAHNSTQRGKGQKPPVHCHDIANSRPWPSGCPASPRLRRQGIE